jgi:hypothetical protein
MRADEYVRVDVTSASREDLVSEIQRLAEVCARWSASWRQIVTANAAAWEDRVRELEDQVKALEQLL